MLPECNDAAKSSAHNYFVKKSVLKINYWSALIILYIHKIQNQYTNCALYINISEQIFQ